MRHAWWHVAAIKIYAADLYSYECLLRILHVEMLVSHQAPRQVADRGTLARYDGYRGNKIPGADQN